MSSSRRRLDPVWHHRRSHIHSMVLTLHCCFSCPTRPDLTTKYIHRILDLRFWYHTWNQRRDSQLHQHQCFIQYRWKYILNHNYSSSSEHPSPRPFLRLSCALSFLAHTRNKSPYIRLCDERVRLPRRLSHLQRTSKLDDTYGYRWPTD